MKTTRAQASAFALMAAGGLLALAAPLPAARARYRGAPGGAALLDQGPHRPRHRRQPIRTRPERQQGPDRDQDDRRACRACSATCSRSTSKTVTRSTSTSRSTSPSPMRRTSPSRSPWHGIRTAATDTGVSNEISPSAAPPAPGDGSARASAAGRPRHPPDRSCRGRARRHCRCATSRSSRSGDHEGARRVRHGPHRGQGRAEQAAPVPARAGHLRCDRANAAAFQRVHARASLRRRDAVVLGGAADLWPSTNRQAFYASGTYEARDAGRGVSARRDQRAGVPRAFGHDRGQGRTDDHGHRVAAALYRSPGAGLVSRATPTST